MEQDTRVKRQDGGSGFGQGVDSLMADTENYVRENPTQSVVYAVAAGLLLRSLPIAALVATLVRIAVACLKPAIVIYAAMKLYNQTQRDDQ